MRRAGILHLPHALGIKHPRINRWAKHVGESLRVSPRLAKIGVSERRCYVKYANRLMLSCSQNLFYQIALQFDAM